MRPTLEVDNTLSPSGDSEQALQVSGTATHIADLIKIDNPGTGASLKITPTGNTSASVSVGGAVNITNTGNTGPGLVVYSNQASPAGRLVVINAGNAGFNQSALRLQHAGTGIGIDVSQTGTGIGLQVVAAGGATANSHAVAISLSNSGSATSSALSLLSNNTAHSTLQITGNEVSRGSIKISHIGQGAGADGNASAISIDLDSTAGTAAQGIFIDSTGGTGTTGNLLEIRNNGANRLRLTAAGNLIILAPNAAPASTSPPMFNGSVTIWLDEAGNNIKFQCRYSGGTVKTGTVALV